MREKLLYAINTCKEIDNDFVVSGEVFGHVYFFGCSDLLTIFWFLCQDTYLIEDAEDGYDHHGHSGSDEEDE